MKLIYRSLIFLLVAGIFSCSQDSNDSLSAEASDTGVAGSYARFIVVGQFMYIVDDSSIKTFNLINNEVPSQVDEQAIGDRIESIFHFDGRLFVGSGGGLFIYEIGANGIPAQLSATEYFNTFETFACDPVVANSTHAYVTLNSLEQVDRPCGGDVVIDVNVLKVYDIADLTDPVLIAEYEMSAPKGVGIDGDVLFVCDNEEGLKVLDISDPLDVKLIWQFSDFTAFDVIPLNGLLLVVGPDNVYQFDYSNIDDMVFVSEIPHGV